ncbi:MAG: AAA family ATPase, partial [Synechococcales cyanobacterium]
MNFIEEFGLLLRARYPILYIPTREEERVELVLTQLAKIQGGRAVYIWDYVDGYQGNPNDQGFGKRNPLQALELLDKLPSVTAGIFILRDFHRFLEDVAVCRKLRNLARSLKSQPKNVVLLSPQLTIPTDLGDVVTVVDFPLPTAGEIRTEMTRLLANLGQSLDSQLLEDLARSAQGLSMERIHRVLAKAIASHHQLEATDIQLLL